MDEVTWGALALTLTLLGALYTSLAYRRRGLAAGVRGAGLTLLPAAAYLTDTLRMATRIGDAVGDWVTGLVLSPSVWVGVVLAGLAVALIGVSRLLDRRTGAEPRPVAAPRADPPAVRPGRLDRPAPSAGDPVDDDMAEIQAILRKRGIS